MKKNTKVIITLIVLVFGFTSIPLYADLPEPPFNCPKNAILKIWAPYEFEFGKSLPDKFIENLTGDYDQGYYVYDYYNEIDNNDVGDCSRGAWNRLNSSGILVLNSHGTSNSEVAAVYSKNFTTLYTWCDDDLGNGMSISWDPNASNGAVLVTPSKLGDMFQEDLSDNDAIVFNCCCFGSSGGNNSSIGKCHGDIGFAYPDDTTDLDTIKAETGYIIKTMNGTYYGGDHREALDAWKQTEDTYNIKCVYKLGSGYEGVTLCPSVIETRIFPEWGYSYINEGSGAGGYGVGHVQFDSHCDVSSASFEVNVLSGSFCPLYYYWSQEPGYEDNAFCFEYNGSNYSVEISAMVSAIGGQELDGGDSTENGRAENDHPYVFPMSE